MSINDLSDTIIAESDRINADDLRGADKVIEVTSVVRYSEKGVNKFYLNYKGDCGRPYKPSLTMRRIIMELWTTDGQLYIGRYLKLTRDPTIKFGKNQCGGIIVAAMSDIPSRAKLTLMVSRGQYKEFTIDKFEPTEKPQLPDATFKKWLEPAKAKILSNEKTNEQIITQMEVKATLTDEQKQQIRDIGSDELVINEDEFLDE